MSRSRKANSAKLAWQAIDYLVEHDLVVEWNFPVADPPPEEIRRILAPYFSGGEIEQGTAWHLRDYLVERLEEDFLLIDEWSRNHAPARRVVFGDDD